MSSAIIGLVDPGPVHSAHDLSLADHRDAVSHREDLVQLVGDEDDALSVAREGAESAEQLVGLPAG